jgi:hypothetical protein
VSLVTPHHIDRFLAKVKPNLEHHDEETSSFSKPRAVSTLTRAVHDLKKGPPDSSQ